MPDDACAKCGAALGLGTQQPLFGGKIVCHGCQRIERIGMILRNLPKADEFGWSALSPWEREFVPSVRSYFEKHGDLTEAQYRRLEEIWERRT